MPAPVQSSLSAISFPACRRNPLDATRDNL
jgi:hypothetical protein